MRIHIICFVIIAYFYSGFSLADSAIEPEIKSPAALPNFLQEVTSPIALSQDSIFYNQLMEKKTLENFDDRFIIVHFWASWCMDCQNELIALNKLQKEFKKKALLVIVISEDFKAISAIDSFFTKHNIDYLDIYIDKKRSIYNALMLNHLPMSYLVDFNGKIIASSIPGTQADWSDETLKNFLDEKVNQYQLLPPEYKSTREKYVPMQGEVQPVVPKKNTQPKIFIN